MRDLGVNRMRIWQSECTCLRHEIEKCNEKDDLIGWEGVTGERRCVIGVCVPNVFNLFGTIESRVIRRE